MISYQRMSYEYKCDAFSHCLQSFNRLIWEFKFMQTLLIYSVTGSEFSNVKYPNIMC